MPSCDIAEFVDQTGIGPLQRRLFTLCALCLIMDGFDVQAVGYAAPALIQEWQIPQAALGPVFGAGNFGVLVGSLVFTMIGDRWGRRPMLVGATLFFAVLTFITAWATDVPQLLAIRFVAGIGLGAIIPNATALIGEYSPRRSRVTLMATISVGFTAGAALGGLLAAWLIPAFGWRSVFYVGGITPLLIALAMWHWLPESLQFLAVRGGRQAELLRWARALDPARPLPADTTFQVTEPPAEGVPVMHLFRDGRTVGTLLLWTVCFFNLYNLYFLSNWLPTVVRSLGYPTQTAVLIGTTLQVGGTLGTFGLAALIARAGFFRVLVPTFLVGAGCIALIGQPALVLPLLGLLVFIAGICVVGSQPTVNALAGTFYPTALRSTGIGWGLGIGRIGAIIGPVIAGEMLRRGWSVTALFYSAALPAAASGLAMMALAVAMRRSRVG
jgi:AAHS family 4-hydroxybenzoate transporter-like MFS transporter